MISVAEFSPAAADATDAIQRAIDAGIAQEATVQVPGGAWLVDAVRGVQLRTGTRLQIDGVLRALPNDQNWSSILHAEGVNDVKITLHGQIIGDRYIHTGSVGEHGMGVMLSNSTNVELVGPGTITNCWGDGIYVIGCKAVSIDTNSLSNRRNNMSVISVKGLTVRGAFNFANGTAPQAGIDLEPDNLTELIEDVDISCQCVGNAGAGVLFGFGGAPIANFRNVRVHDMLFKNNKPISGVNSPLANLLYATCRWAPGYDWWGFPRSYTIL